MTEFFPEESRSIVRSNTICAVRRLANRELLETIYDSHSRTMSAGAAFNLILKDDRFDKYFTLSEYLQGRIRKIRDARELQGDKITQPTFADIERTHILYLRSSYKPYVAMASEYVRVKASGGASAITASGGTLEFTFPVFGHFTSDMAIHIRFAAIGVPPALLSAAPSPPPFLRYCAIPGARLFKNVSLQSGQTSIDSYTPDDVISSGKFFIDPAHRLGWERCMGQQEQREASFYGNGFTGSFMYRDGPQTPKQFQESFDIFAPAQFWFCNDLTHSLFNEMVPNTQRKIVCELAPLQDIIQALIPGVSIDPLIPAGMTPTALPFSRVSIQADLYVNSIYVNPEIYDVFASRCGASLIRVHRRQTIQLPNPQDSFLLNSLKFPLEYLMIGVRSRLLAQDFDRWWMTGAVRVRTNATKLFTPAIIWDPTIGPSGASLLVNRECIEVTALDNLVDTIGITAHGIEILPNSPSVFFNSYVSTRYAKNSLVVSPIDTGSFLATFCAYPGKFKLSGYYNLSTGRELYLDIALKVEPAAVGGVEAVLTGSMLNLLLYRGDGLALMYSL